MKEFRPLSEELDSQLVGQMLDAARSEAPDSAALHRTLGAVGLGSAVGVTASAANASALSSGVSGAAAGGQAAAGGGAAAGHAAGVAKAGMLSKALGGSAGLVKWAAGGAAAGLLVLGVAQEFVPEPPPVEPIVVSQPVSHATGAVAEVEKPEDEPTQNVADEPDEAPVDVKDLPQADAEEVSQPEPARVVVSHRSVVSRASRLSQEVALIDQARAQLSAGRASRALKLARDYQRRFPKGTLVPESNYLAMEAQLALGRDDQAKKTAKRLQSEGDNAIHSARAREVLGQ